MGAMGAEEKARKSSPKSSSDSGFYMVLLALVVGMGFYISYDINQRYGDESLVYGNADSGAAVDIKALPNAPVIVNIEKIKTVEVVPVATVPATEDTPEAVVVEKVIRKTTVTTAIVPVPDTENAEKTESEAAESNNVAPQEAPQAVADVSTDNTVNADTAETPAEAASPVAEESTDTSKASAPETAAAPAPAVEAVVVEEQVTAIPASC